MKILVLGAHGLTGQRILRRLVPKHEVFGAIRPNMSDHRKVLEQEIGAKAIEMDLLDLPGVDKTLQNSKMDFDAYVFAAGAASKLSKRTPTPEQTTGVDDVAARHFADLAAQNGKLLFILSGMGCEEPDIIAGLSERMQNYMHCKARADRHALQLLQESNRNDKYECYIFRPGALTEEKGSGRVSLKENPKQKDIGDPNVTGFKDVSRDNVADVMVRLIDMEPSKRRRFNGKILGFVDGDVPIDEALETIVKQG